MRVRTYCFPGCFTRPPGHLDSQPPPRADHVEAKSPPGGNAQESVLDLDQLLVDATVPRSGATSLRDTTTTRTALSSLFAPAHCRNALVVHSAASNCIAQAPERLRAREPPSQPRRPQFLAGGSGSQLREVPGSRIWRRQRRIGPQRGCVSVIRARLRRLRLTGSSRSRTIVLTRA